MLTLAIMLLASTASPADARPAAPASFAVLAVLAGTHGAGAVDILALDTRTVVHRSTNAQGVPSNGLIAITPWTSPWRSSPRAASAT